MAAVPPIRVVTRALAEMQTAILAEGLRLTGGDIERFAIFSLIARMTMANADQPGARSRITIASLAGSLSKPYETVRRHVGRLVADGLCARSPAGLGATGPDGPAGIRNVWIAAHAALVRFVERLGEGGVDLPLDRHAGDYSPEHGVAAAVDLMLTVVDGNRGTHASWMQLAIFSAILNANYAWVLASPAASRTYRDESVGVPAMLRASTRAATVSVLLSVPETTVRRHIARMIRDGRLERTADGVRVSEPWLNQPPCVEVSRRSFANVRRILEQLAARNFPFDRPSSARLVDGLRQDRTTDRPGD